MSGCGARRGYSWHQRDHGYLSPGLPQERPESSGPHGGQEPDDQGEAACSCLDSWCPVCVCVCVVWACSHAQVCRRTALTQAGAVCVCMCVCVYIWGCSHGGGVYVCVCVCVCVFGAAVMVGGCECVCVCLCVCVVWACSYEPVCGGTALT